MATNFIASVFHQPTHNFKSDSRPIVGKLCLAVIAMCVFVVAPAKATIQVKDDSGATIRLERPAQRVMTLAPNLTELAFTAGAGAKVIGVTRFSDYPEAAKSLPVVSDAFTLNLEAIAIAKPDLIFAWISGTPQRQRDALKKLGIPVYESEIQDVAGIASTIARMGQLMGTSEVANKSGQEFLMQWKALLQSRSVKLSVQGGARLRVFYQVWDKPLMTFNGKHLVSHAIDVCGGVQGFDKLSALTPTVSREAVLAFDPQLILSGDPQGLHMWERFPKLSATAKKQLKLTNAALLTRMGPRFVKAAEELCAQIDAARLAYAGNQRP
jgi:iron complex transport system substrate-binding protein